MTAPGTIHPEPMTPAAAERPRDPATGRVLLPIKAEVWFRGRRGPSCREHFATWPEAAAWATGIAEADHRVKSIAITWRHPDPGPFADQNKPDRPRSLAAAIHQATTDAA